MLTGDTTKRYGCLKNGVKDITWHRLYNDFDWKGLLFLKLEAPYIPNVKSATDTSNFNNYPDSTDEAVALEKAEDIFLTW